jgi:hypothetical protein
LKRLEEGIGPVRELKLMLKYSKVMLKLEGTPPVSEFSERSTSAIHGSIAIC